MKNETSNRRPDITLNDVEIGDVLLSCGRGELSRAIRLLDGGDYSHAALCVNLDERDGPKIVESTRKGVVENPLAPDNGPGQCVPKNSNRSPNIPTRKF